MVLLLLQNRFSVSRAIIHYLWSIINDLCVCEDLKSTSGPQYSVDDCRICTNNGNVYGFVS